MTRRPESHRYRVYLSDGNDVIVDARSEREASEKILRKFRHLEVEDIEDLSEIEDFDDLDE